MYGIKILMIVDLNQLEDQHIILYLLILKQKEGIVLINI